MTTIRGVAALLALALGQRIAQAQTSFPQGTPVGRSNLRTVGESQPQVGTSPGKPIGMIGANGETVPLPSQEKPVGALDVTKNLVAPVVTPALATAANNSSAFQKIYQKWRSAIGLDKPATQMNWTPGLARRQRERRERESQILRD